GSSLPGRRGDDEPCRDSARVQDAERLRAWNKSTSSSGSKICGGNEPAGITTGKGVENTGRPEEPATLPEVAPKALAPVASVATPGCGIAGAIFGFSGGGADVIGGGACSCAVAARARVEPIPIAKKLFIKVLTINFGPSGKVAREGNQRKDAEAQTRRIFSRVR